MKRLSLAVLCCLLLAGCIFEPVFDASSWIAYQRSSAAVKAKLDSNDLRRLEVAIKYLFMENLAKNRRTIAYQCGCSAKRHHRESVCDSHSACAEA
ncbi:MAG: DUF6694 family lipoprotein [Bradyrhizobium sp.]